MSLLTLLFLLLFWSSIVNLRCLCFCFCFCYCFDLSIVNFKVSLFLFLFMLLFWSFKVNLWCPFCFKTLCTSKLGCFRKSSQPNLSTFYPLSLSLYFHHFIFHPCLPPSLTFPFPPCAPGCCCC